MFIKLENESRIHFSVGDHPYITSTYFFTFSYPSTMFDISLIIQVCSKVLYSIWPRNHTSHNFFYFNEFVANVLRDVIGIFVFDLRGHGGC